MRTLTRSQKTVAALAIGALGVAGTGVAYAYWTATGSGTGSAATGNVAAVTVVQTSTVGSLYPGISQSLSGTFTNPNTFPVYVAQVDVEVNPTWSSGTCDAADFTVTDPTATNAQVLVDDSSTWSGGSIELINKSAENQNDCKGVTVPLVYTSN